MLLWVITFVQIAYLITEEHYHVKRISEVVFPEVPSDEKLIRALFLGRKTEVVKCMDAFRQEHEYNKICAIYGRTQMGKSHFAKYIINEAKIELPTRFFCVEENGYGAKSCLELLARIYHKLVAIFMLIYDASSSEKHDFQKLICDVCYERINLIAQWEQFKNLTLFELTIKEEELNKYDQITKSLIEGSVKSKIWGIVSGQIKLGLSKDKSHSTTATTTESQRLEFKSPNEETYYNLIVF